MAVGHDELDRMAEESYRDRHITGSVYCGNCGYNLKTLPHVYDCPECGQSYNARPRSMNGIFLPQDISFPFGDWGVFALLASVGAYLLVSGGRDRLAASFVIGLICAIVAVVSLLQAWTRTQRYFRAVTISRRIEAQERDE